jgi:recombination protein RecA
MDKMDKVQALESALKQIERDFGKGSIMKLGDVSANMNMAVYHLMQPLVLVVFLADV